MKHLKMTSLKTFDSTGYAQSGRTSLSQSFSGLTRELSGLCYPERSEGSCTRFLGRCPQNDVMTQSGRTLLETMAVLAIMGVLSVAAVATYNYAINKARANLLVQDARILHANFLNAQTPHDWQDETSSMATKYPKQSMVDKALKPYVKVSEIDKTICQHLMAMMSPDKMAYFDTDWEAFTTCKDSNEIIFSFDGQGKKAECLAATECPDADNQICNSDYQCADCEGLTVRNEEGTECICDSTRAVSCSTDEGEGWCCEKGDLCGWSAGECVPDNGCWYNLRQTNRDNKCHYTLSSATRDNACKYELSETKIANECRYTLTISADNKATLTPDSAHKCKTGYYCNLRYSSFSNGACSGTAASNATEIWGACNDVTSAIGVCGYSKATLTPDPSHKCQEGYYCNLKYASYNDGTCSGTAASDATEIWGACNDVTSSIGVCTYASVAMQADENYQCALGYYCNLKYPSDACTGTADSAATDIWGACNDVTSAIGVCSYAAAELTPKKSCPPHYYCNLRWADQSCATAPSDAETIYGRCQTYTGTNSECLSDWGDEDE